MNHGLLKLAVQHNFLPSQRHSHINALIAACLRSVSCKQGRGCLDCASIETCAPSQSVKFAWRQSIENQVQLKVHQHKRKNIRGLSSLTKREPWMDDSLCSTTAVKPRRGGGSRRARNQTRFWIQTGCSLPRLELGSVSSTLSIVCVLV